MAVPTFDQIINPTLKAIINLGGSASLKEIEQEVGNIFHLTDEDMSVPHNEHMTKVYQRVSFALTYLRKCKYVENSKGVWIITSAGREAYPVKPRDIRQRYEMMKELERSSTAYLK